MTSIEERERRRKRLKRNIYAKELRQTRKYLPKVERPKTDYKRKNVSVRDIDKEIEDEYDT